MTWWIIGALCSTAGIAIAAWVHAVWASKRIDTLNTNLRESITIVESARGEVLRLHADLKTTNDQLTESRRAHASEVEVLNNALTKARDDLAKTQTPDGIREGLTRRPT